MRRAAFVVFALFLTALPAVAMDAVIRPGIDTWTTMPELTYADFRINPLPAGFFCADSPAFTGRIWLQGVPIASDAPDSMGTTDTIIERLDRAVFNKNGVARTRIRVRALQLAGVETLKNACGEYTVKVTLDGEQPLSNMRIVRETPKGGRFFVALALNVKLTFTRVDDPAEQLELAYPVRFPVSPHHHWAYRDSIPTAKRVGRLMVDTDWDGTPDALLPGTSNFSPGHNGRTGAKAAEFCADQIFSSHGVG